MGHTKTHILEPMMEQSSNESKGIYEGKNPDKNYYAIADMERAFNGGAANSAKLRVSENKLTLPTLDFKEWHEKNYPYGGKKPAISRKVLREWIIGAYAESVGIDLDKAEKSTAFADEVMSFLTEHNLLVMDCK